jgi:signal-transduction protein with cAMP-binding, CBS, and nucleotidyltransferase domain
MEEDEWRKAMERWRRQDAEFLEAERKFAAAIREYLWDLVRIYGDAEWEEDPNFALLAVTRVAAKHVCYKKLTEGTEADSMIVGNVDELVADLDDLCQRS